MHSAEGRRDWATAPCSTPSPGTSAPPGIRAVAAIERDDQTAIIACVPHCRPGHGGNKMRRVVQTEGHVRHTWRTGPGVVPLAHERRCTCSRSTSGGSRMGEAGRCCRRQRRRERSRRAKRSWLWRVASRRCSCGSKAGKPARGVYDAAGPTLTGEGRRQGEERREKSRCGCALVWATSVPATT